MACDNPLRAYRQARPDPETGKRGIVFNSRDGYGDIPIELPCGQCTGCRLDRAQQMSMRIMHESKMHDVSCFLTLTYDDQHVPQSYGLEPRELQLFMKRLRKAVPQRLRFYACGEYGDLYGRPHYHAIIFNYDPPDKKPYSKPRDHTLYTSRSLTDLWGKGSVKVGDVTPQSAGYVARYAMKKITGDRAHDHYARVSPIDGQAYNVHPEFARMSNRPGLGLAWLEKFRGDVFPSGFVIVDGRKQPPPRYYKEKLGELEQERLKRDARKRALVFKAHQTPERRKVRAAVRDARISSLKRTLGEIG